MTLEEIETAANAVNLTVFGVTEGIVLLGPHEPGFWDAFKKSTEWNDGQCDPMDRWSTRIIAGLAQCLNAKPHFPFGTPPAPFLAWATAAHSAWQSPVGMLVQTDAGLMVSFRGALEFDSPVTAPAIRTPCPTCEQPCVTACPVGALTQGGYDVPACHAFIKTPDGADCMNGCLVRRSCPISQTYARDPEQSAYHMERFLK